MAWAMFAIYEAIAIAMLAMTLRWRTQTIRSGIKDIVSNAVVILLVIQVTCPKYLPSLAIAFGAEVAGVEASSTIPEYSRTSEQNNLSTTPEYSRTIVASRAPAVSGKQSDDSGYEKQVLCLQPGNECTASHEDDRDRTTGEDDRMKEQGLRQLEREQLLAELATVKVVLADLTRLLAEYETRLLDLAQHVSLEYLRMKAELDALKQYAADLEARLNAIPWNDHCTVWQRCDATGRCKLPSPECNKPATVYTLEYTLDSGGARRRRLCRARR